jgi:glycerol-3-phosphate dehydrogenase (NAD(P)+)
MGAHPITFAGLSGMGDLIVTCMSRHSRNRFVGEELGKGRKVREVLNDMVMVAEGVPTAKSVHQLAMKHRVEMPLASEVYQVLYEGKDASQAILDVMLRDARAER